MRIGFSAEFRAPSRKLSWKWWFFRYDKQCRNVSRNLEKLHFRVRMQNLYEFRVGNGSRKRFPIFFDYMANSLYWIPRYFSGFSKFRAINYLPGEMSTLVEPAATLVTIIPKLRYLLVQLGRAYKKVPTFYGHVRKHLTPPPPVLGTFQKK